MEIAEGERTLAGTAGKRNTEAENRKRESGLTAETKRAQGKGKKAEVILRERKIPDGAIISVPHAFGVDT